MCSSPVPVLPEFLCSYVGHPTRRNWHASPKNRDRRGQAPRQLSANRDRSRSVFAGTFRLFSLVSLEIVQHSPLFAEEGARKFMVNPSFRLNNRSFHVIYTRFLLLKQGNRINSPQGSFTSLLLTIVVSDCTHLPLSKPLLNREHCFRLKNLILLWVRPFVRRVLSSEHVSKRTVVG